MKRKKLTLSKQTVRTLRNPDLSKLHAGYYQKKVANDEPDTKLDSDCLIGELNWGGVNVGGYDGSDAFHIACTENPWGF